MDLGISGKRILVTGAGRGLGRTIALLLAAEGAHVVAAARTAADLDSLAQQARGGVIECAPMDVCASDAPDHIAALGPLHGLINNAGANTPQPFLEVDDATLDRLLDLNVRSAFRVAQAAARSIASAGGGGIVMMSSQMGHVGSPRRTVYCMSKHALEGLSKAMAVELAPLGVRVNCVGPTFIDTPMTAPMLANPEFRSFVLDRIPMGRLGLPEEVARAAAFLVSPAASLITGASLVVDGGWTAQ